jgi:hypothetical protein
VLDAGALSRAPSEEGYERGKQAARFGRMMNQRAQTTQLGDGLILRRATRDDIDALAAFDALVHGGDAPDTGAAAALRDLLGERRPHPTTGPDDVTIVEDMRTGEIVSSLSLIPQTLLFGGVRVPAAMVERVGTLPAYRRRGLVRRQFAVVHRWCVERGLLVQTIGGIPWFYRQFGYEYAIPEGPGRVLSRTAVPPAGEPAAVTIRPARAGDAAFIAGLDASASQRYLVSFARDETAWRFEIEGRSAASDARASVAVLETHDRGPAGFVAYACEKDGAVWVLDIGLAPGESWLVLGPAILRFLVAAADAAAGGRCDADPIIRLGLGADHPLYRSFPDHLSVPPTNFAFYVRVPDLTAFLAHVAPVLERRLATSVAAGWSGELRLDCYRHGVRLAFEDGRLSIVELLATLARRPPVAFPELTFIQLLFGFRSLDELLYAWPDARAEPNEARVLLEILFPKLPSRAWPIY